MEVVNSLSGVSTRGEDGAVPPPPPPPVRPQLLRLEIEDAARGEARGLKEARGEMVLANEGEAEALEVNSNKQVLR